MATTRTDDGPNVVIGCQGGGSHTAFTAGVLQALFEASFGPYTFHGISGTSGGALCATTAWYGNQTSGGDRASDLLESLWLDLAATEPAEWWLNEWTKAWVDLQSSGYPLPRLGPSENPAADWGQAVIRRTLERHVDFAAIPDLSTPASPELIVSAVDVVDGQFAAFGGDDLTVDHVLASTAVPRLFPAVEVNGHPHWDGLFAQNPPIRNFLTDPETAAEKPDEIWVVRVNPLEGATAPRSMEAVLDRRSEISGNLSLLQERAFIRQVNEWVDAGVLPDDRYKHVDLRWIELEADLSYPSRFDRAPSFVRSLLADGRAAGRAFLAEHT